MPGGKRRDLWVQSVAASELSPSKKATHNETEVHVNESGRNTSQEMRTGNNSTTMLQRGFQRITNHKSSLATMKYPVYLKQNTHQSPVL